MSATSSREYPSRPILSVGAIIVEEGRILVVRRGAEPGKGRWSVPGGAVEIGESVKEAVVREVLEESNLVVTPVRMVGYYDYIDVDSDSRIRFHYVIIYWLCERSGGELGASSDIVEARWIRFNELKDYDITEGTMGMLARVKAELSGI